MEEYVRDLLSSISQENDAESKTVLLRIQNYLCSQLSKDELEVALSALLPEGGGLIIFIKRASAIQHYRKVVSEIFELLMLLIENHGELFESYAGVIREVCMSCVLRDKTPAVVKQKALASLAILLQTATFPLPLEIPKVIEDLLSLATGRRKPLPPIVVAEIYTLLGVLSRMYLDSERYSQSIFSAVLDELKHQTVEASKVDFQIIEGCFKCLSGFLEKFSKSPSDDPEGSAKVYGYLRKVIECDTTEKRTAQRAAIDCFSLHGFQLAKFIATDYKWWHSVLLKWLSKGEEERKVTFKAINTFYSAVAEEVVECGDRLIFSYFMTHFKAVLTESDVRSSSARLCVKGFGYFTAAGRKHPDWISNENVSFIFDFLLQRGEAVHEEKDYGDLSDCLWVLSCVVGFQENAGIQELRALERLAVLLVDCFPRLHEPQRPNAYRAITSAVMHLTNANGNILDNFIHSVVYQSAVLTVSHPIVEDVELQEDRKDVISYKNYLPLWEALLNMRGVFCSGLNLSSRRALSSKILDELVRAVLTIVSKLDLELKRIDDKSSEEFTPICDPGSGLKAVNPRDFTVLANTADLLEEVLKTLLPDNTQMEHWIVPLSSQIVTFSNENPLVSSFHKMLAATLTLAHKIGYFESEKGDAWKSCFYLVSNHVQSVASRLPQYKENLQVESAKLLLSVPPVFVGTLIPVMAPVFQVVFRLGRSMLWLAHDGLATLRKWTEIVPREDIRPLLKEVLPYLDFVLSTKDSAKISAKSQVLIEGPSSTKQMLKRRGKRNKPKTRAETKLTSFQFDVLLFLSTLPTETVLSLIEKNDSKENSFTKSCGVREQRLLYHLPFTDMKVPIYLDELVMRTVELSLDCSDRRTRIHAIELLHALVMFMLGTEIQMDVSNRVKLNPLWQKIFPCVLRLGCDADQTVLGLFHPLGLSLTHWYSGKEKSRQGHQTESLLEAILEGLIHPTDSALRDYSAKCLHEFSTWSIRQGAALQNVKALFRSIDSYVKHPCPFKRLGGGLAFNSIYAVLRENKEVLDIFWIEMVCSFVKGLSITNLDSREEETSRQLSASLRHFGRALSEKSDLFNKESEKRRCPAELDAPVLKDLVRWLLFQCTSESVECRHQCMMLVWDLAPKVEGFSSTPDFVTSIVKDEGMGSVVMIVQRELNITTVIKPNQTLKEAVGFCNNLISSFECCNWILQERLVDPGALFSNEEFKLPEGIQNFVTFVKGNSDTNRPKVLNVAMCTAIIRILDFLIVVLKIPSVCQRVLTFWSEELAHLISACIFSPLRVGFDPYSKEVKEELPKRLKDYLRNLSSTLPTLDLTLRQVLQLEIHLQGSSLSQKKQAVTLRDTEFVTGCLTLHEVYENKFDWSTINPSAIVQSVFDGVVGGVNDSNKTVYLIQNDPDVVEFGGLLLRLATKLNSKVDDLITCLLNENVLLRFDGSGQLSHGGHFFSTYRTAIIEVLLNDGKNAVEFILRNLQESKTEDAFAVIIALLEQSGEHGSHSLIRGKVAQVSEAVLDHWDKLQEWGADCEKRKSWLVAVIKHVALSQRNPYGCLANHAISKWIFGEINSELNSLKLKIKLIGLLAFVIVRQEENNEALRCVLQSLRDRHFPLKSEELRYGSEQHTNLTRAFRALLRCMEATGNADILRGVIRMSATDEKHVCEDDIHKSLTSFVERCRGLSLKHQERVLFLPFSMFKDECPLPEIRLRIVRKFLIPMLRSSSHAALAAFFQKTVRDLITLPTSFRASDSRVVLHQLVTRIGKTEILEIMVSRLQRSLLEGRGSPIVESALSGQRIETGKELIQNICKLSLAARKLAPPRSETSVFAEMFRQMHCAAYNMLSALLCATKTSPEDGRFYTGMLFTDNEQQIIWQNIVDSTKNYLPAPNYDEIPERRKVQVSVRKQIRSQPFSGQESIRYLSTQQTLASSLSQDITRFDFSHSSILPAPLSEGQLEEEERDEHGELELESDVLNRHECMAMVCAVIKHVVHTGITPAPKEGEEPKTLPSWMEAMRTTLLNPDTSTHVRLFLLKVILNCQAEFRPYATFWLPVLLFNTSEACLSNGITYFLSDLLTLMLSWHSASVTRRDIGHEKMLANQLLVYLVENVVHSRRDVFRYHLDLIKNTVETWKHAVEVPRNLILEALTPKENYPSDNAKMAGVQLSAIMLANRICPWDAPDKFKFFDHLVSYLSSSSKVVSTAAAETIGLALDLLDTENKGLTEEDEKIVTNLTTMLKEFVKKNKNSFFVVLNGIHLYYPAIVERFFSIILIHFTRLQDDMKVICLNLLKAVVEIKGDQFYQDFKDREILVLLENGSAEIQAAVLRILKVVLKSLTIEETLKVVKIMALIREHSPAAVRLLLYEVAAEVHDNFINQESSSRSMRNELEEAVEISKELLLWGLVDEDNEIKKKIYGLWTTTGKLPVGASERILSLFENAYSTSTEHHFMSCASELMLEAVSATPDYDTLIFRHALADCLFQDYRLLTSWKAQHMSLAPMFAETLASQLSSSSSSSQSPQSLHPFLLATQQSLAFQPTMDTDWNSSFNERLPRESSLLFNKESGSLSSSFSSRPYFNQGSSFDSVTTNFSSGSHISRRFWNSSQQKYNFALRNIREKESLRKKEQEKLKRQAGEIAVYRSYRVGDFPDIQIKNLDIIRPLQALSKRDATVSRHVVVALFSGVRKELSEQSVKKFEWSVSSCVNDLLGRSEQYDPILIATLLELALQFDLMLDSSVATSAAKNSQLLPLGALVLENMLRMAANAGDLIDEPVRSKRPRLEPSTSTVVVDTDTSVWMELAEMYRSMGEVDIVKAIFQSKVESHPSAIAALDAAAAGEWYDAKKLYLKSLTEKRVDYFYEDYFNCLAQLSEWKGLSKSIMNMVDNKNDELWSDVWNMENLLSWLVHAEVLNFVTDPNKDDFLHVVKSWLENSTRSEYLKAHFSEDLTVIFLTKKKFPQSSSYAKRALSQFLDEWACLDPFSEKLRKKKLLKSLTSAEILMYLKEVQGHAQFEEKLNDFYGCLKNNMPSPQDSLVLWEPRINYRRIIIKQNEDVPTEDSTVQSQLLISVIETALNQGNHWMAKKYISLAKVENPAGNEQFDLHLELANLRERLLWSKTNEGESRLKNVLVIWRRLDKVSKLENLSRYPTLKWTAHSMECDLAKCFCKYVKADPKTWLSTDSKLRADLLKRIAESRNTTESEVEAHGIEDLLCEVELLGLKTLRVGVGKSLPKDNPGFTADAYFEIAQYCRHVIERHRKRAEDGTSTMDSQDPSYLNDFKQQMVKTTLSAMKFGSANARQLFPLLLNEPTLSVELCQDFKSKSSSVPEWMFLDWIPQLLATLDTQAEAVEELIFRIAKVYPQALAYPLRLCSEKNSNKDALLRLRALVGVSQVEDMFVLALSCVCHPMLMLFYHLEIMIELVQDHDPKSKSDSNSYWNQISLAYARLKRESTTLNETQNRTKSCRSRSKTAENRVTIHGQIYDKNRPYYPKIEELSAWIESKKASELLEALKTLLKTTAEAIKKEKKKPGVIGVKRLKDFSPWLNEFQCRSGVAELEIPGQYTGSCKPQPQNHVRIAGFKAEVSVMPSMRLPVRITMIGSDAREYPFLVKSGEDLRQDERIQQLLLLMNKILKRNQACNDRRFSLKTYKVIPMTSSLGVIEWVGGTRSLKEVMTHALDNDSKVKIAAASVEYSKLFKGNEVRTKYGNSYLEVSPTRSQTFTKVVNLVPLDCLRLSLEKLSSSPEEYFSMRQSFATSYASMCIAHWILGIGDRHQSNCLVSMKNGQCIGIDFGHAFGTATQCLTVPELLPFRLTPHILRLTDPLMGEGSFKETMIHTLRAVRADHSLLVATMQVFVLEPSVDWLKIARRHAKDMGIDFNESDSEHWLHDIKMQQVNDKLNGANPVLALEDDLQKGHAKKSPEFLKGYLNVLKGQPNQNSRAKHKMLGLTPVQQVECLIDLATDYEVLSRTYEGWEPFM